jgi:hypothetical protein
VNAKERVVERDEAGVKPHREDCMDKSLQFFEEEDIQRQRIPMPREMEHALARILCDAREEGNCDSYGVLNRDAANRVADVAMKNHHDGVKPGQVAERDPLEWTATVANFREPVN